MKILKYRFAIHSDHPDRLVKFYTGILGLKLVVKVDREDEFGFSVEAASGYKIWIAKHSEISGQNKDQFRILMSFYVDNIDEFYQSVKKFDPKLIVEHPTEYCKDIKGEARLVCAFLDPDGNCIQMMQIL